MKLGNQGFESQKVKKLFWATMSYSRNILSFISQVISGKNVFLAPPQSEIKKLSTLPLLQSLL